MRLTPHHRPRLHAMKIFGGSIELHAREGRVCA